MRSYGPYYVAVRKPKDEQAWIDIHTITPWKDDVRSKAREQDRFAGKSWAVSNPVVQITKIYIIEDQT